jgi:hypothetical protein
MFIVFLLILPAIMGASTGYIASLLMFIAIISGGGYLIRNISP